MILGGFLGMMTETGALDNGIAVLVQKLKGNEIMLIPVLMLIFSLGVPPMVCARRPFPSTPCSPLP